MNGDVNVVVTDGFTGNVALKTAEGTANFLIKELKKTLTGNIISKISSLINFRNITKFKNKLVAVGYLKDGNFYPKNLLNNLVV